MTRWVLFSLFVLVGVAVHAEVYRWVDAEGKIHYSDQLPPSSIKQVEKKKPAGGKPVDTPLPYALQQAVKNFPVTLYSSECGDACTRARQLLTKRGIPFTDLDATDPNAQKELRKLTGGPIEVPILKIGRDTLRGFEEGKWNTSLDAAGYPQTSVIPFRAPAKTAKPGTAASTPPQTSPSADSEE